MNCADFEKYLQERIKIAARPATSARISQWRGRRPKSPSPPISPSPRDT